MSAGAGEKFLYAIRAVLLMVVVSLYGGCASIVHHGNRAVTIDSIPTGATVTISKLPSGEAIERGKTPLKVSLDPKGGYFRGQRYSVAFSKPGYEDQELELHPSLSGWYLGNIMLGGLIGMIAVDPCTGAMWNLEPKHLTTNLLLKNRAESASNAAAGEAPSATIVEGEATSPREPSANDATPNVETERYKAALRNHERLVARLKTARAEKARDPQNPVLRRKVDDLAQVVAGSEAALQYLRSAPTDDGQN